MDLHPCPNCQFPCLGKQCKECHFRMVFERNKNNNNCIDCGNEIESEIRQTKGKRCRCCQITYNRNNTRKCKHIFCRKIFISWNSKFSYCKDCFFFLKSKNENFCKDCTSVLYFKIENEKLRCFTCIKKKKINMRTKKTFDNKHACNSKCVSCDKNNAILYCKDCFNDRIMYI